MCGNTLSMRILKNNEINESIPFSWYNSYLCSVFSNIYLMELMSYCFRLAYSNLCNYVY